MTLTVDNLHVEVTIVEPNRYETTSVKDAAGQPVHVTLELLERIEEAIEDTLQADAFEADYWNAENPAFLRLY